MPALEPNELIPGETYVIVYPNGTNLIARYTFSIGGLRRFEIAPNYFVYVQPNVQAFAIGDPDIPRVSAGAGASSGDASIGSPPANTNTSPTTSTTRNAQNQKQRLYSRRRRNARSRRNTRSRRNNNGNQHGI